ncbi:TPA: helix-turn-helix domain-containing protein [Proteus mirabilis]
MQTDRAAHEAWGKLSITSPRAASLAHFLCAHMDRQTNAVVASWATLAQLAGMSVSTTRRAMNDLEEAGWVEGINLGRGSTKAWRIDSRVAWSRKRDGQRFAYFHAAVLASGADNPQSLEDKPALRRIPIIAQGETALPTGDHDEPPTQPSLEGLEPVVYRDKAGNKYDLDPDTGEIQQRLPD